MTPIIKKRGVGVCCPRVIFLNNGGLNTLDSDVLFLGLNTFRNKSHCICPKAILASLPALNSQKSDHILWLQLFTCSQ